MGHHPIAARIPIYSLHFLLRQTEPYTLAVKLLQIL